MIYITVLLFLISLPLLVLGFRGRVVQRGQFCRKCRFNLAGIDFLESHAVCPECGHAIASDKNRRPCLRARMWLPLIAGCVMMLAALGLGGMFAQGNQAFVFRHSPDRLVMMSAKWGNAAALDEMVTRLSGSAKFSDSKWKELVEYALEFQADLTQPWDARWGEVLMVGTQDGHLSDEQVRDYIVNGHAITIKMREKLNEGTINAPVQFSIATARISSINGGVLPFKMSYGVVGHGVIDHDTKQNQSNSGPRSSVQAIRVPGVGGSSSYSMTTNIHLKLNAQLPISSEQVPVFVEYEIAISASDDSNQIEPHLARIERTISIVDRHEELIARVPPIGGASMVSSSIFIDNDIIVADPLPAEGEAKHQTVIDFYMLFRGLPQSISYQSFIRTKDGEELPLRQFSSTGGSGHRSYGMQWSFMGEDSSHNDSVRDAIAEMIDSGEATIVLRVDVEGAIMNPDILEVLDQDLIFEHVGVRSAPIGEFNGYSDGSAKYAAKHLIEDESSDPNDTDPDPDPDPDSETREIENP